MSKKSNFGLALALGAALGGAAAFFLSPKSGKENRELAKEKLEDIKKKIEGKTMEEILKEIFGHANEEGRKLYTLARAELNARLDQIQSSLSEIDREKYTEIVKDVIAEVKKETEATKDRLAKLQDYLMHRWDMAQEQAEKDTKKVVKDIKKETKKA